MFKKFFKKRKPAVHRYTVTYLENDDEFDYFGESADAAIAAFLSERPNVKNDLIFLIDYGVMKDPDDRA